MRRPCCHIFLAFLLKFMNFLQIFIGVCIIIYSSYMLNHWHNHHHHGHPLLPSAPSPYIPHDGLDVIAADDIYNLDNGLKFNFHSLPAPWFIYAFMGVGIMLCCTTCIGQIAAEAINGCCLCFYAMLTTVFILLEVSLVAFIALDHSWEKDLPSDPTGELDSLRTFIEENMDICKWVGIAVITIQALSLLLAIILRALVSSQRVDAETWDEYNVRGRTWEPLLNPHLNQTSVSIRSDSKGNHSDFWSSRMREKYGLNNNDVKQNLLDPNTSVDAKTKQ